MKHNFFKFIFLTLSLFSISLTLLLLGGCQKDNIRATSTNSAIQDKIASDRENGPTLPDGTPKDYALTTHNISLNNGMLYFPNYDELAHVISSLDAISEDPIMNNNRLSELGLTRFMPNVPEEPMLDVFNARFNMHPLRHTLEEIERLADENDSDDSDNTSDEYDISADHVLFWDESFGSVINQNHEIRVGNLIYKYIDDNRTLVFNANNSDLLNLIRTSSDPYNLPEQFNLFKIDERKEEALAFYKRLENANRSGECMFQLTWSNTGNQFFFHSIGYFPVGGLVTWKVIDGAGEVIQTQSGQSTFSYLIPAGVQYPLTVSIESEGCSPYTQVFASASPSAGYNCDLFNFDYEFGPNDLSVVISIPPNTPTIFWNLAGTTLSTPPTGSAGATFTKYFADDGGDNGANYICATVQTESCTKNVCKNVGPVGCGGVSEDKKRKNKKFLTGFPTYKCKAKYRMQLKDPLNHPKRFTAKFVVKQRNSSDGVFNTWVGASVTNVGIYWNSSPGRGWLKYFFPLDLSGSPCGENTSLASIVDATGFHKIKDKRNVPSGTTCRIVDFHCQYEVTTLINGGGFHVFNL
jgi:hypothetical protein